MDRRGRVRSPARAGALLSRLAGGPVLLIAWIVPVVVGLRVVQPIGEEAREKGTERRHDRALLTAVTFLTGIFTGLLANGGGFLPSRSTCCCSACGCGRPSAPACWSSPCWPSPPRPLTGRSGTSTGPWRASSPSVRCPAARSAASSRTACKDRCPPGLRVVPRGFRAGVHHLPDRRPVGLILRPYGASVISHKPRCGPPTVPAGTGGGRGCRGLLSWPRSAAGGVAAAAVVPLVPDRASKDSTPSPVGWIRWE